MDKSLLEKFLNLLASENDSDAVMGLRGAQNLYRSEGLKLEDALRFAAHHPEQWRQKPDKAMDAPVAEALALAAVNVSGVPQCRVPRPGILEIVPEGKSGGELYPLPGESAAQAEAIALHMKDAVVVAVINKSRFKLKLNDIKNGKGEVVETVLQSEYERAGMAPVRIWQGGRGEVGALATVLRKAISNGMPDLVF